MDAKIKKDLQRFAVQVRIGAIEEFRALGVGHIGGSLSIADVLAVLYGAVMNVDPKNPKMENRDKLVCSKGHSGPAVYSVLALKGFFPYEQLVTLNQPHTNLPSHCDRNKTPGIDATTGSLGQGTSLAVGMALGDKIKNRSNRVFLIVGDGELDEGQAWEAAMFTASRKLTNLVWIIDNNKRQLDGYTSEVIETFDLEKKFAAFGFDACRIDGHDVEQLYDALTKKAGDKPIAIIMDNIKGAGVRDVENTKMNHSLSVTHEQGNKWIAELNKELEALAE